MRFRLAWISLLKVGMIWAAVCVATYFLFQSDVLSTKIIARPNVSAFSTIFDKKITSVPSNKNYTSSLQHELKTTANSFHYEEGILKGSNRTPIFIEGLPVIYMVTPTYRRAEQIPELTRTAQTLLHVKNLVWIVAEDAPKPTPEISEYLSTTGIKYVYLRAPMPQKFAREKKKPRGVSNRNAGIEWIRENATDGVVYFGDDDNTYDLRIFEEMRSTKGVSMFPVGLVTKLGVSSPIVKEGKVIGFYDGWIAQRKFPVDMAGFAINVRLFKENPKALMPFKVGYEEDGLLQNLHINPAAIEPKAENCTKIWVWHTQTKKNLPVKDSELKPHLQDTNLVHLRNQVWRGT